MSLSEGIAKKLIQGLLIGVALWVAMGFSSDFGQTLMLGTVLSFATAFLAFWIVYNIKRSE